MSVVRNAMITVECAYADVHDFSAIVDKNASGGNTFYVNGEVHDW